MKKPYFTSNSMTVYHGDFRDFPETFPRNCKIITDPPYNIGFDRYDVHQDNMSDDDYIEMICELQHLPVALIQYPEEMFRLVAPALGNPQHLSAWCYNSNTPRRFRLVGYWNCEPDYSRLKQPYENRFDSRVQKLMLGGSTGSSLYEWWDDIQLVKNVSLEKTNHPCPIPEKLAKRIISLICHPGDIVVDPFAGSLTVLKAAKELGYQSIGYEKSENYIQEGLARFSQETLINEFGKSMPNYEKPLDKIRK